jgi:hypothetical protein
MTPKKGEVYRATTYGLVGGYLWLCEGKTSGGLAYRFKSVATGQSIVTPMPERWFEEAEDDPS